MDIRMRFFLTVFPTFFLFSSVVFGGQIKGVGSSSVYPFTSLVSEFYGRSSKVSIPVIESTGTGGGFQTFCSSVGTESLDLVNASRPIQLQEKDACLKAGVTPVEFLIGYDGIVLGQIKSGVFKNLSFRHVYLALSEMVYSKKGILEKNVYKTWRQVDSSLPDIPIKFFGPPPSSGTRDSFIELFMHKGCDEHLYQVGKNKMAFSKEEYQKTCAHLREDGPYVDTGENDSVIMRKLKSESGSIGIFGYSYLENASDIVEGIKINNVEVNYENIAQGTYPGARPLYIYVKKEHFSHLPDLKDFLDEYFSDRAMSADGYLVARGLIPVGEDQRRKNRAIYSEY